MSARQLKSFLFEQVARIGKAVASPKRLEMLDLLGQGEKSVEELARGGRIDVKLASAHLKALRNASLVAGRRDGKRVVYRLTGDDVPRLLVLLRGVAEAHLADLQIALARLFAPSARLTAESRRSLLRKARAGEIVVIDVRPEAEYRAGHLPAARSMPLDEIRDRLAELPAGKDIVAYCRGPFCLMSDEAVRLLARRGLRASKIADGVAEWRAAGLPLETHDAREIRP
ncbi:MAG: metalloregulator ArsR/SmtB family transcription factor [Alphaproteobacteria bacterium]|nr:metalloregulator ArsR/SmtB family transcription factor [Alphaproteobacteria bacterium]